MIIEIHTAAEAFTTAHQLLEDSCPGNADHLWQSYTGLPLAAVLLATAHANGGFADLTVVRDVLVGPSSEPGGPGGSSWLSVADRCPAPLLSRALRGAADLTPVQRDSMRLTALDALARS